MSQWSIISSYVQDGSVPPTHKAKTYTASIRCFSFKLEMPLSFFEHSDESLNNIQYSFYIFIYLLATFVFKNFLILHLQFLQ